jgi:hypothetical protein
LRPTVHRSLALTLFACLLAALPAAALDMSPIFSWARTDSDGIAWTAAGPLFESQAHTFPGSYDRITALPRPVYVHFSKDDGQATGFDFLWPLVFGRWRQDGAYQFALLFLHTSRAEGSRQTERWWLLPFFYYGRDAGGQGYFGFFPVGGNVRNLAGFDDASFWLWPLYVSTERGDTKSHSVLWPVFSWTRGSAIEKWRIFPIYGRSETPARTQQFIIWPLGHIINEHPPQADWTGAGFFILPLFGRYTVENRDDETIGSAWTVLWPFFSGRNGPRESRLNAPWPFFQKASAKTATGEIEMNKLYVWPFYGKLTRENRSSSFILWPFYHHSLQRQGAEYTKKTQVVPFYWASDDYQEGQKTAASRLVWPFYRYERRATGDAYLRALALWPMPSGEPVLRDYAPLWQLYRYDRQGGISSHSLLWGLWQHERKVPDQRRFALNPIFDYRHDEGGWSASLLKGFFGWGRDHGTSTGRLLWFVRW